MPWASPVLEAGLREARGTRPQIQVTTGMMYMLQYLHHLVDLTISFPYYANFPRLTSVFVQIQVVLAREMRIKSVFPIE